MNELQAAEKSILAHFINVCEKLGLKYYLVCGSALGAVKYGGFIPWDDDIDVALPRKDYEVFLQKGQALLQDYLFIQNYRTDKEFHLIGTKIRDIRTTYIEDWCGNLDIRHGVFIDVFPLDSDSALQDKKKFARIQRAFEAKRRVRLDYRRFTTREVFNIRYNMAFILYMLFGCYGNTDKIMEEYEKIISSGNLESSRLWCNFANSVSEKEYAFRKQYGEGMWSSFEGLKVRIPERYDEYLTQKYGDWRADLPENQKVGHHYAEVIDLTRPYTDYIVKLKNGKIRLKTSKELLSTGITPPEGYKY